MSARRSKSFNADWRSDHGLPRPPIQVEPRAWYNANLETRWNLVPALVGTITMMSTLMLAALSVAREREEGTFDQLLVTPFRPVEIMAGKAIPAMMIGIVQATNALLVAQLWFRIPFAGSYPTLYVGLILFLLAAVGIGLFVSSIAATMQQAMLYAFVTIMPFALLSGLTTPISSMPRLIQDFTLINPLRYAIDLVHRVYLRRRRDRPAGPRPLADGDHRRCDPAAPRGCSATGLSETFDAGAPVACRRLRLVAGSALNGIVTSGQYRRYLAALARRRKTQVFDFAHVGRGGTPAIDK